MELKEIIQRAKEIQKTYKLYNEKNSQKEWGATEYTQGLVGDVGDLMKLVMAKNGLRNAENIDEKLAHELADCLWSIIIIAEEFNIDLEKSFFATMAEVEKKIK